MTELSQGAKANKNGKIGEETLEPLFKRNGYTILSYTEYAKNQEKFKKGKSTIDYDKENKLCLKQVPYTTIYGAKGKTEFVIINKEHGERRIRIEVKWQESAGSVDEKYPYVYLNSVYQFPEKEIIIIIDGNGYKAGAKKWIEEKAKDGWLVDGDKIIKVMGITDFMAFFNKELV